jgi:pimeloyl-ACP methyl ester carboxylesterase
MADFSSSGQRAGTLVEEVDIGGVHIAYRRAGHGPPLVLLHGGPTNGREWRNQLDGLSDEFTVVAWDMPGTGGSDDPPEDFRPRDYADCLAGFIDRLGLAHPDVLGLSFGSGLAIELYRWHPEIPRSLVLASAYAGWAGSLSPEAVAQRKAGMARLIELPPDAWAREWLPTLLTPAASPEVVDELSGILREFHPAGQRALLRSGWTEHDARDVLPHLAVPTLLLYGDRDVRSPVAVAEAMHAQIPGSRLVFMPGVGHMGHLEQPARFNAEVRGFLRTVGGTP